MKQFKTPPRERETTSNHVLKQSSLDVLYIGGGKVSVLFIEQPLSILIYLRQCPNTLLLLCLSSFCLARFISELRRLTRGLGADMRRLIG